MVRPLANHPNPMIDQNESRCCRRNEGGMSISMAINCRRSGQMMAASLCPFECSIVTGPLSLIDRLLAVVPELEPTRSRVIACYYSQRSLKIIGVGCFLHYSS